METKLKPCPFCGGVAQRVDIPADEHDPNAGGSYIACQFCLASSSIAFGDKSSLVDNWNNRAGDARIRAEARAEAASLYERQYEELRTWNAERSTQERWWDMIARHKHERDVFILADEPKEREAEETDIDFVEPTSRDMQIADEVRMCKLGVGAAIRVAKYRIEVECKLKEAKR